MSIGQHVRPCVERSPQIENGSAVPPSTSHERWPSQGLATPCGESSMRTRLPSAVIGQAQGDQQFPGLGMREKRSDEGVCQDARGGDPTTYCIADSFWYASRLSLLPSQACLANPTRSVYSPLFPVAHDQDDPSSRAPSSAVMICLLGFPRECQEVDSSAGFGRPMEVGSGYVLAIGLTTLHGIRGTRRHHSSLLFIGAGTSQGIPN